MHIHPVILSGGSGTRLWPLSRALYPKQLLPLISHETLLQETIGRVGHAPFAAPLIICNGEHRFIVAEQFREVGVTPLDIVLEPTGRNTAPAAAVAALLLERQDPDAIAFLLPSDHLIRRRDRFYRAIETAAKAVGKHRLVTFGIEPHAPETGFGYIRRGTEIEGVTGCFSVAEFVEKPDSKTAEDFLAGGEYAWNSGMFLFSVRDFLEELDRLNPGMVAACRNAIDKGARDLDFLHLDADAFEACPAVSIDVAVMERTDRAAVVPASMGWSDIGSWSALWEISNRDGSGNVVHGDIVTMDVTDSYLRSEGPLLAAVGLDDMIVVATQDAVLVAPKDRAQDVRHLVNRLEEDGERHEHIHHVRVHRPWGWYQSVDVGHAFQVKRICVNPGAKLSLQYHHHRAEHWVVVSGTARVTHGEDEITLVKNQSTYIPIGVKHRLENQGDEPLHIIEVQFGDYLGEDDIVRLEDIYARS